MNSLADGKRNTREEISDKAIQTEIYRRTMMCRRQETGAFLFLITIFMYQREDADRYQEKTTGGI